MAELCLTVSESTLEKNSKVCERYCNNIDLIELRVDGLDSSEFDYINKFPEMVNKPVIFTIRKEEDGGLSFIPEKTRMELFKRAWSSGYEYIDIEYDALDEIIAHLGDIEGGPTPIISRHNFEGVPEDLDRWFSDVLSEYNYALPKAAVKPNSMRDCIKLLSLYRRFSKVKKILIGMGGYGIFTRICAELLGSAISYTSKGGSAATGQISVEDMIGTYGFHAINRNTVCYGIIGNPVLHSASPQLHNKGYKSLGINAVYVPFPVDSVKDFMDFAEILPVQGFSVTIPYKSEVITYLEEKSGHVEAVGACNTVYHTGEGWKGENTDIQGFLEPLLEEFSSESSFTNKSAATGYVSLEDIGVTVIGAGGAARGVVHALINSGARVLIINRTVERAEKLAQEFNCKAGSPERITEIISGYQNVIVQTTSVGMRSDKNTDAHDNLPKDPIEQYDFIGTELVYDIIYTPKITPLLQRAQAAGCKIITGDKMLFKQGIQQFKLFTGREYPEING